jgi:hypothetical protein
VRRFVNIAILLDLAPFGCASTGPMIGLTLKTRKALGLGVLPRKDRETAWRKRQTDALPLLWRHLHSGRNSCVGRQRSQSPAERAPRPKATTVSPMAWTLYGANPGGS